MLLTCSYCLTRPVSTSLDKIILSLLVGSLSGTRLSGSKDDIFHKEEDSWFNIVAEC